MSPLVNDPSEFAATALTGFAAQNERVLPVAGGVVRATESPDGQVAVVMGGGSGHFPAFAGWVGPGFGHGAACGNVFASPSEQQILTVSRAARNNGGIIYMPINYAGDILHFSAAAETLRAEGIDVRMVPITDDIVSAPSDSKSLRRGIAGSFTVMKIVGAASARGWSLDEVERVAVAANEATRTLGVAFSGCTLPGRDEPLFTVAPGRVAVGLGIHGEPGVSEVELGRASDVADLIVDGLLEERPAVHGVRATVFVNGLGATKYDELFVVFERVRARLADAGMTLVAPVVGEQVTSLDMAGLSVSVTYLDEELEPLWLDPADIYSFSRGGGAPQARRRLPIEEVELAEESFEATEPSRESAAWIADVLERVSVALAEAEARLGAIDSVAGDGDHGTGMLRGASGALTVALRALANGAGAGTLLARAGAAWSDQGGGTSGALWGTGLDAAAEVIGDELAADASTVVAAARAFADAIAARGKAVPGDKTMMDAIIPFCDELEAVVAAGRPLREAWIAAADRATVAAEATAQIPARLGRSRTHGERSIGTPDAGAVSFALIVRAIAA